MISHAPSGYVCPFCRNVRDGQADLPLEILYRDQKAWAKMNPRWRPNNPGSVLVMPLRHYENIFDLPDGLAVPLQRVARSAAIAMKTAFGCDGVSTRQHNEPAGNQVVWHYHLHVFPRWHGDELDTSAGSLAPADEMRRRADELRSAWPDDVAARGSDLVS